MKPIPSPLAWVGSSLHDKEQDPRMITAIQIDLIGLQYRLAFGTDYSWHYEQELTDRADTLKRLG